ncbi:MAG: hypothetical protein K5639_07585 [Eubacterium sp.]|nr:hypothetical protein [Eubacterium sp.]
MAEKFDFLNRIDPSKLTLYPLQIANMERIENNDAVYIFDEVGCGKTISSGFIAWNYLEKNPEKGVLVITINSLIKTGQFKNDLFNKFPFTEQQQGRFAFVSNHEAQIHKIHEKVGLIIIDEAQEFLSDSEPERLQALKKLKAEKVVFLTATPIRKDEEDINKYIDIACCILDGNDLKLSGETYSREVWHRKLTEDVVSVAKGRKECADIICAQFNPLLPVTRYFKDTVRGLEPGAEGKIGSIRRFAKLWKTECSEYKWDCLFRNIDSVLADGTPHHFIVFATKQQACFLGYHAREKEGYVENCSEVIGRKTYYVITGDNSSELSMFDKASKAGNPTVIFVNYTIAEQGINFPGFDYVVNYQISAFPSRLEQRFGRVDRLGREGKGVYDGINVCYVLKYIYDGYYDWNDTSTRNFFDAIERYSWCVIPFLPSRNVVFDDAIMCELESARKTAEEVLPLLNSIKVKLESKTPLSDEEEKCLNNIRNNIQNTEEPDDEESSDTLSKMDDAALIKREIERWKDIQFTSNLQEIRQYPELLKASDQIFVKYDSDTSEKGYEIVTFDAEECADIIRDTSKYSEYESLIKSFDDVMMYKKLHAKGVTEEINLYLALAFTLGNLNAVYPLYEVKQQMKRMLSITKKDLNMMYAEILRRDELNADNKLYDFIRVIMDYSLRQWGGMNVELDSEPIMNTTDEERVYLIDHAEQFLNKLPIYTYLNEMGKALFVYDGSVNANGVFYARGYIDYEKWINQFAYLKPYIECDDGWEPSPIFKLFYHFERIESDHFQHIINSLKFINDDKEIERNYKDRENLCKNALSDFLDYKEEKDTERKEIAKRKIDESIITIEQYNESIKAYTEKNPTKVLSWFENIFNEEKDKRRKFWKIKKWYIKSWDNRIPVELIPYENNNNNLWSIMAELLCKENIKKKLDYWSYSLIKEMLDYYDPKHGVNYLYMNPEIKSVYKNDNGDSGFDFESIGITEEDLKDPLISRLKSALSPWLGIGV